jgi:glycosyltransferase involved in cell wall biosynthesis
MSNAEQSKKTTVVHVVGTMRDGGAEALVRTLVPRLADEPDLDMHFVSIYGTRLEPGEIADLGVPVHEIGRRNRADLSFAPRLIDTLRQLRPTVVHGHSHSGKFAGRIFAVAAGVPNIVFSEHGDPARGIVHWSVNRLLNARTSRFIVFTDGERERYAAEQRIPLSRIAVIPNGISVPAAIDVAATRRECGLHPDDFAIVSAARLVPQKNQDLLIRSVAALRGGGRGPVRLLIIGQGPDLDALQTTAAELNIADCVTFMGFRRDAQRLTSACDVMALGSRWEKMPLVLGEAMLAGIPVVSTPWTGIDAFITDGDTGYLSADWSVEAFTAALGRAMDDRQTRAAIAARAQRAASERFSLKRAVQLHADLYRELVSRRRAS